MDPQAQLHVEPVSKRTSGLTDQAAVHAQAERVLAYNLVELIVLAFAIIGAVSIGLGVTEYLRDHAYVFAYLLAYAGFRVARYLLGGRGEAGIAGGLPVLKRLGELPALLLFAAAPFERTYIVADEPPLWTGALGLLMGLSGMWLALGAQIQLDRHTRSAADGPSLLRTGLFRHIRHPVWAGECLAWMGWPLIYGAPLIGVAMVVGGGLIIGKRIRSEEAEMLKRFGDEYASYMRETDRLIPSVW